SSTPSSSWLLLRGEEAAGRLSGYAGWPSREGRDGRKYLRPGDVMFDSLRHQAVNNASSRSGWERYAAHRRVVTSLLTSGTAGGRLCVLGAGNGNDLDLPALLKAFREVHLVDLDAEALTFGTTFQKVAGHPGLRTHEIDVAGVDVRGWSPGAVISAEDLA